MQRVVACLRSYVAAWWMKLIAAAMTLVAVGAVVSIRPATIWEPAWRHPHLVKWFEVIPEGGSLRLDEIVGLAIEPGCFSLPAEQVRSLIRVLSRLQYCRVELPDDPGEGVEAQARAEAAMALFDELGRLPALEAVELRGLTAAPVDYLARLRGNPRIRRLYTSSLDAPDARTAADWFGSLVDSVVSFPSLAEWGLPRDAAQRLGQLDAERIRALGSDPSLRTLRVPPDRMALGRHTRLWCRKVLPGMKTPPSFIDRGRLAAAWGVLAATVFVAGFVVISAAGMLLLSAAAVVPRYAESHRLAVFLLLATIALLAAIALVRLDVAVVPAVLWAAVSTLVPAALLEWDRRRPMPGILVMPVSLAWCVGFMMPLASRGRGWWWVWLDAFFETSLPTTTTWWMLCAVVALGGIAWWALGRYAVSLGELGRISALTAPSGDAWRQFGRVGRLQMAGQGSLWAPAFAIASRAVRLGRLSSCATPAGCRRLLAEGMMTVPKGRLLLQGTIVAVLMPLMMSATVPAFRERPELLATAVGAIALMAVWFRPVLGWRERAARLPGEIGCLLPRRQYLDAMRGLLQRQMLVPMLVVFTTVGAAVVWRSGQWWPLLPLAGLLVAAAALTVSVVELMLTIRSPVLTWIAAVGIAYPAMVAGTVAVVVLLNVHQPWPREGWARLVPFLIVAVMAGGLRLWLNRRMLRFEFGRLG